MVPQVVKYRLWALSLRMNPQTVTYAPRVASTTPGMADTFPKTYQLLRVVYREPTLDELKFMQASVNDVIKIWTITQVDLDQSGAPTPAMSYTLTFADGTVWTIESVKTTCMGQAFECTCRQEPLGN